MPPVTKAISQNLAWLQTMKQPGGYAGPVTHYWSDSLTYTGPGTDWRYEGLIPAYISLYRKTKQAIFKTRAIECGEFILHAQCDDGSFQNSAFEANPSFKYSGTPHEAAVCNALFELAQFLRKEKMPFQKYENAALKNIENVHLAQFWDDKRKTFLQFQKSRLQQKNNLIVPNKIATTCEALLHAYDATRKNTYLHTTLRASESILEYQDKSEWNGGIYQSDMHDKIIPFYTARCIPVLVNLFERTKEEKYLDAALNAGMYVKKHQRADGFFSFGENMNDEASPGPFFIAGAGDIGRALQSLSPYKKISIASIIEALISSQRKNGAFPTKEESKELPSWKDQLGAVGLNDKALRFLSENMNEKDVKEVVEIPSTEEKCCEGVFRETSELISIVDPHRNEKYHWNKHEIFARSSFIAPIFYRIGNTPIPIVSSAAAYAWQKIVR